MISLEELKDLAIRAANESPPKLLAQFCRVGEPDECYDHYYNLLYLLAKELEPETILELGTELGRGTFALALGSPDSDVITVDISGQVPSTWLEWLGRVSNIRIVSGTDSVQFLLANRHLTIGLAFIDSSHTFEATMSEFCLLRPLMEEGGVVCLDDLTHLGTGRFWHEIGLPKIAFTPLSPPSLHGANGFGTVLIP